ncbi:Pol polyprotein, partial [Frankliniella fusca]
VNTAVLKVKDPLSSVAPPRQNLQQIGVDIIQLPEADGFKFVVVAIDYISKYSHAKALENKSAGEVARFIFEWICLFGCPKVVINDQGREFVNEVGEHLFHMTGTHQRITSAYNPQANGHVERQNAEIVCKLLKVLRQNISKWPSILDGIMFAHRVQKQQSTGYSPFFLLFGQEPILPLDVMLENAEEENPDDPEEVPEVTLDSYLIKIEHAESIDTSGLESITEKFVSFKQSRVLKSRENIKDVQNTACDEVPGEKRKTEHVSEKNLKPPSENSSTSILMEDTNDNSDSQDIFSSPLDASDEVNMPPKFTFPINTLRV